MKNNDRKTANILSAAAFLNDFGANMVYAIWPIFVTSVMGANMSLLGLIDGFGDALVSISQAASGYVSDRTRKRKIFVYLGYAIAALSRIGYAISSAWQHVLVFRIMDRSGKIRDSPRDAIIADISRKSNRGNHFGILRAMDNLGAICGILVCIALLGTTGYQNLFLLAAIPSLLCVALVYFFIKEKRDDKKIYKGVRFRDMNKSMKILFLLSGIFALGYFSYSFLLVFASKSGFEAGTIPIFYLIFTMFAFLSSIPFGKLSDRIGRKPVLAISFLLWAAACASLIMFSGALFIVLSFVIFGMQKGAFDTVNRAYVSELAPRKFRASMLGGFQMVIGLCALPASLMAGLFWDSFGMAIPFYFAIITSIVALALLAFVKE